MGVAGGSEHAVSEHELLVAVPRLLIWKHESIEPFFVSNIVEFTVIRRVNVFDWLHFFQWAEPSCWMRDFDWVCVVANLSFEHAEETSPVESDLQIDLWTVETDTNYWVGHRDIDWDAVTLSCVDVSKPVVAWDGLDVEEVQNLQMMFPIHIFRITSASWFCCVQERQVWLCGQLFDKSFVSIFGINQEIEPFLCTLNHLRNNSGIWEPRVFAWFYTFLVCKDDLIQNDQDGAFKMLAIMREEIV